MRWIVYKNEDGLVDIGWMIKRNIEIEACGRSSGYINMATFIIISL